MTRATLTFRKPNETYETGRILAFSHDAYIGRIYPIDDGRAMWFLHRTDERGEAKSVQAAKEKLAEAFRQWLELAGLVQS